MLIFKTLMKCESARHYAERICEQKMFLFKTNEESQYTEKRRRFTDYKHDGLEFPY